MTCVARLTPHVCSPQGFLNSSSCPEIQGFLHVKEMGRKSWKKLYLCLRRSGLYCSTKGSSKVSAGLAAGHLQRGRRVGGASTRTLPAGQTAEPCVRAEPAHLSAGLSATPGAHTDPGGPRGAVAASPKGHRLALS